VALTFPSDGFPADHRLVVGIVEGPLAVPDRLRDLGSLDEVRLRMVVLRDGPRE
jgi:hypothetical protein